MTNLEASQIAGMLNARNQLVVKYDAGRILSKSDEYLYRTNEHGAVVACLELKRVQWYQFEVRHVSVEPESERRGHAWSLLESAEKQAISAGGRILQCTIRAGNSSSIALFTKARFSMVSEFHYPVSGNQITVWQKVISSAP